jgi:hypothetical protein
MPDTKPHTPADCSLITHCHEHLKQHIVCHKKIKCPVHSQAVKHRNNAEQTED